MHRVRRAMALISLGLVASLAMPMTAFANILEMPSNPVSSETNAVGWSVYQDYPTFWRETWGNTPYPTFSVTIPSPDPGQRPISSAEYVVRRVGTDAPEDPYDSRVPVVPFDWSSVDPALVYRADTGSGPWRLVLDMPGLVASTTNPFLASLTGTNTPSVAATDAPGWTKPYEGSYQVDIRFVSTGGYGATYLWTFGIDVTPPAKVTGLAVQPDVLATSVPVLTQTRAHLTWDDKRYDGLAGVGYFAVYIDGKPFGVEENKPARLYDGAEHFWDREIVFWTPRAITIEGLPSGRHNIQVRAVDRAGNAGPLSDPVQAVVDTDTPTIAITAPATNGQLLPASATLKADARDLGGVKRVTFYIDGVPVATDTVAPYQVTVPLTAYAQMSTHTLTAEVEDMAGRTASATRTFVVDRIAPTISNLAGAPNPFYPRLRDGYKDNFIVTFNASENCTATVTIRNAKGAVVRSLSKRIAAGAGKIVWDGKWSDGQVYAGDYTWRLTLKDNAGNTTTSSARSVKIRFYEVIRVNASTVRIVER